ncbi:hypothetical protein PInf_030165 [Phytophthora infestans]|nr:hypothetical protein PInf_030165 [Phytophthora infestans]
MPKRRHIKPLTWTKLWTKLKKLGWQLERPKGLSMLYDEVPPAKRPASVSTTTTDLPDNAATTPASQPRPADNTNSAFSTSAPTPTETPAKTPTKSPVRSSTRSSARSPTKHIAKSQAKSPAKSPAKAPSKSPAKAPPKTRVRSPTKAPTTPKKRAGRPTATTPVESVERRVLPPQSARLAAQAVDISAGDDRMSSGDEDEYGFDDDRDDMSDIDDTSDGSEDEGEEVTSDEEDAVGLSVGTPFDKMSKEKLSEHAKTGWTAYFEDECTSLQMPAAELTQCTAAPTELAEALDESSRYQHRYRTQAADVIMARQKRIKKRRPAYKMKSLQQFIKDG